MTIHTKGNNTRKIYDHPPIKTQGFNKPKEYFSNFECFTCHKMGHIAISCPMKVEEVKKMKIFHAHGVEDND